MPLRWRDKCANSRWLVDRFQAIFVRISKLQNCDIYIWEPRELSFSFLLIFRILEFPANENLTRSLIAQLIVLYILFNDKIYNSVMNNREISSSFLSQQHVFTLYRYFKQVVRRVINRSITRTASRGSSGIRLQ